MTSKTIRWLSVFCVASLVTAGTGWAEVHKAKTVKKTVAKTAKSTTTHHAAPSSGRAVLPLRSADPYLGAIAVDAATGQVLIEKNADTQGFPASVIKLMDMMVIMDHISAGQLSLSNMVTVTAAAARTGGSQVYLAEKEVFPLEDLMYALMVQSANDAAMAMAIHVGGSAEGFVDMMNKKAAELGMTNTVFHSPHGLPPAAGQKGDTSTAHDLAKLAKALIDQHPEILQYTSTRSRPFREGKFIMRSHNHLLDSVQGCDGLKTGFISAGGFSIVVTAQRGGRRVIVVVLGSRDRKVRDAQAAELVSKAFAALPSLPPPPPPPPPAVSNLPPAAPVAEELPPEAPHSQWLKIAGIGLAAGIIAVVVIGMTLKRRSTREF